MKPVKDRKNHEQRRREQQVEVRLNRLFVRVIASALLFLLVFVGGNLIPERACDVYGEVQEIITGGSILPDTVQMLGQALTEGDGLGEALRDWCVDTFLPSSELTVSESGIEERLNNSGQFSAHLLPKLNI